MGDEITGAPGTRLQRRKGQAGRLTEAKRRRFLDELSASCNVTRATAAGGATMTSFYKLRRREPAFAEAWEAAIATGYARLEAALLAKALGENGGENGGEDGEREAGDPERASPGEVDPALALQLLSRVDARKRVRDPQSYGKTAICKHVPIAEVEAALMRELKRLAKLSGRSFEPPALLESSAPLDGAGPRRRTGLRSAGRAGSRRPGDAA